MANAARSLVVSVKWTSELVDMVGGKELADAWLEGGGGGSER